MAKWHSNQSMDMPESNLTINLSTTSTSDSSHKCMIANWWSRKAVIPMIQPMHVIKFWDMWPNANLFHKERNTESVNPTSNNEVTVNQVKYHKLIWFTFHLKGVGRAAKRRPFRRWCSCLNQSCQASCCFDNHKMKDIPIVTTEGVIFLIIEDPSLPLYINMKVGSMFAKHWFWHMKSWKRHNGL